MTKGNGAIIHFGKVGTISPLKISGKLVPIMTNFRSYRNWQYDMELFSDKIFSELLKRGSLEVPGDLSALAKEMKTSYNVEVSEERIPRIVSKLVRERVIDARGKVKYLTMRGVNRYKRTTNLHRKIWKQDSYGIICTWITI